MNDRPEGGGTLGVAGLVGDWDRVPVLGIAAHRDLHRTDADTIGDQLFEAFGAEGLFAGP